MKKINLLLLTLCVVTCAWAQNHNTFAYSYMQDSSGQTIGLELYAATASGDVTIPDYPAEYGGRYAVLSIAENAFNGNTSIKSVKLPSTCLYIKDSAFEGCSQIESIAFGPSLISIGNRAFYNNSQLKSINLPNTVETIGNNAFWFCKSATEITLGNSLKSVGDYAFQYCHSLESISLPNTLRQVGEHFLCGCPKIERLVIPASLTTIGDYFLHGCEKMREVYLMGDQKRTLGSHPFISNNEQGFEQVTQCVFYVESEDVYKSHYKNEQHWALADKDNHDYITGYTKDILDTQTNQYVTRTEHYANGGNYYSWERPTDILPHSESWVTACYPTDIDVASIFGEHARVAEMEKVTYKGTDTEGNHLYHIDFRVPQGKQTMKAHTPYLLKADPKNVGSAYIVKHSVDEASKADTDLATELQISNQGDDTSAAMTKIKMLGTYKGGGHVLAPGEFLFANANGTMKFYKKIEGGKQRSLPTYRCYWQVIKDGDVATNAKIFSLDNATTGIKAEAHVHSAGHTEVFNLSGQMVAKDAHSLDRLPAGIYIVNGKKQIVK